MDLKESKRLIEELIKRNLEEENIALEMEVKASKRIIHNLKSDTELLLEYEEAVIDKDDLIRKFEKGKTIADNVKKNLKEEINVQGNEMLNVIEKLNSEKETVEKEMLEIRKENILKEENLKMFEDKLLKITDVAAN